MRSCAVLALSALACATGRPSDEREIKIPEPDAPPARESSERPFIKLADRRMALVVHVPQGVVEDGPYTVEGVLASDLKEAYRTEVPAFRREGAFAGFDDELFAELARGRADDVVVVQIEAGPPLKGTVQVILLGESDKPAFAADIPVTARGPTTEQLRDLAHRAWIAVTRGWTDPGAHRRFDGVAAGQRLAKRKRCDLAVPILTDTIGRLPKNTVAEARKLTQAESALAQCEKLLALARREEEDARATFRLDLDVSTMAPPVRQALAAAFAKSPLTREVAKLTTKPAKLSIDRDVALLEVRYHPEWYLAQVRGRERYLHEHLRALYLDPWLPTLDALLDVRADAEETLGAAYSGAFRDLRATLRLTKLNGDYVDIDFIEKSDRIMFGDQLRVKLEGRAEMLVTTPAPKDLRQRIFLLGPAHGAGGETTDFGLLWAFFALPE